MHVMDQLGNLEKVAMVVYAARFTEQCRPCHNEANDAMKKMAYNIVQYADYGM